MNSICDVALAMLDFRLESSIHRVQDGRCAEKSALKDAHVGMVAHDVSPRVVELYSDCLGIVETLNSCVERQISHRLAYAGIGKHLRF